MDNKTLISSGLLTKIPFEVLQIEISRGFIFTPIKKNREWTTIKFAIDFNRTIMIKSVWII